MAPVFGILALLVVVCLVSYLTVLKGKTEEAEAQPARTVHPFRLAVKLTTDPEAASIVRTPQPTTLEELIALPHSASADTRRLDPLETHVWRIEVTVTRVEFEPDGDVVFEIEDGDVRSEMEAPEPSLATNSPLYGEMVRMRLEANTKIDPSRRSLAVRRRAVVTGVGFAGLPDSRTPSGVRLYPVLSIEWREP